MEYAGVKRAIREVQRTLENLAMGVAEPEFKRMAGDAAGEIEHALAAIYLRNDQLEMKK